MDSEPLVANVFHDRLIGSQPPKDMDDDWILEEIFTTTSIRPKYQSTKIYRRTRSQ